MGWPRSAGRSGHRELGDIYRLTVPGHDMVVVCDPREMVKVLQVEGRYPYGMAEGAWPFQRYHGHAPG